MKTMSIFALVAGLAVATPAVAQMQVNTASLTPEAIVSTMKEKATGERQAYAAMVISSIASMPISDEEKIAKIISAARALIAGSKDGNTIGVIAEIYNSTPVQYLPAIAKMLAGNFDQELNGFDDAKMALYIEKIVGRSAAYIEASGCDSPAIRAGILAATFLEAATNKEAATATIGAALPASFKEAALAYAQDVTAGNVETIAQGAGIDSEEITETPATDPDADRVVTVAEKTTPAAETPAVDAPVVTPVDPEPTVDETTEEDDAAAIEAIVNEDPTKSEDDLTTQVPLLSRFAKDVSGVLSDTVHSTLYDWEEIDMLALPTDPLGASLLGLGNVTIVPGEATPGGFVIVDPESPLYDGQR